MAHGPPGMIASTLSGSGASRAAASWTNGDHLGQDLPCGSGREDVIGGIQLHQHRGPKCARRDNGSSRPEPMGQRAAGKDNYRIIGESNAQRFGQCPGLARFGSPPNDYERIGWPGSPRKDRIV